MLPAGLCRDQFSHRTRIVGLHHAAIVRTFDFHPDANTAPIYPAVLDDLVPSAWHHVERHANNPIEADHSQLKRWLRPMRGLQTDQTVQVIIAGHAFMQNLRRRHYELGLDSQPKLCVASAFSELARVI